MRIEGLPCTGTRGEGPVYENAVRNEKGARRRIEQIETDLRRLRTRRKTLREEVDRYSLKAEPLQDSLAQVEALSAIVTDSWGAALFCGVLFLLTVGLELMVVFIKLAREGDDYDMTFEHYMRNKKEVASTRMALLAEMRIAELEENPRSPGGTSFIKPAEEEPVAEVHSEKLSLGEALEQRRRSREARHAAAGNGRAQRNGQPSRNA